jgi:hypothetical protein
MKGRRSFYNLIDISWATFEDEDAEFLDNKHFLGHHGERICSLDTSVKHVSTVCKTWANGL